MLFAVAKYASREWFYYGNYSCVGPGFILGGQLTTALLPPLMLLDSE